MNDLFGEHSISELTTPFASVIGTNHAPSQDESVQLKALLVEPQIRLSQLETEISRLQDLLDSVTLKRDSVKKYIEGHRALMSPIRRVPPETLSQIFTHCLPGRYAVRDTSEAPLLLTGVSRQWRHTAINTPALWRSLHIFLPSEMSPHCLEQRTVGSSLWLKRSGSLPLSISLSVGTPLSDWSQITDPEAIFMKEILLKHSNRIEELSFAGSTVSHMAAHLDQLASHFFPILKVLRVCQRESSSWRINGPDPFASLAQQMPALISLAMVGFSYNAQQAAQLQLGWENLTELVLSSGVSASQQIVAILGRTCRLQSLTISVNLIGWSTETIVLNLPSMRKMWLHFSYYGHGNEAGTCLQNFFHSMVCPSLKTLYALWSGRSVTNKPFSTFSPLEEFGTLDTLLLDMPLTSRTLKKSLALNPKLRVLEVMNKAVQLDGGYPSRFPSSYHAIDNSILSSLSLITEEGDHMLCPDLQHIRIVYKDKASSSIKNSTLLTFLETRVYQTKTLQSCDIFFAHLPAEFTEDENRRFRRLVDSGLKLRIRYGQSEHDTSSRDMPKDGLSDFESDAPDLSYMEGHGTEVII